MDWKLLTCASTDERRHDDLFLCNLKCCSMLSAPTLPLHHTGGAGPTHITFCLVAHVQILKWLSLVIMSFMYIKGPKYVSVQPYEPTAVVG